MKYWVYIKGEVPGCFTPPDLIKLEGFCGTTLVCPAEGEVLEKNWRRAGEFSEILAALQELAACKQPAFSAEAPAPIDIDKLLDSASHRLFGHVSELMKELERHREEKALVVSLQRQVMDLKDQLQGERERCEKLETRLPRLEELEASRIKYEDRIKALESAAQGRDRAATDLRIQLEKTKNDLDTARSNLSETANDLAIRNRLVEKLNDELTEKEVSLTKALSLLRRLDEDLGTISPDALSPEHRQQIQAIAGEEAGPPAVLSSAEAPFDDGTIAPVPVEAEPSERENSLPLPRIVDASLEGDRSIGAPAPMKDNTALRSSYTTDEPLNLSEVIMPPPPDQPAAHNALVNFLKRVINKPEV